MKIYALRVERSWFGLRVRYMAKVREGSSLDLANWQRITEQELMDSVSNLRDENLSLANHVNELSGQLKVRRSYAAGGFVGHRPTGLVGESTPDHQMRPASTRQVLSEPGFRVDVDIRKDAAAPLSDLELEIIDSIAGERLRKSVRTDLSPPPPHSPGFKASSVGTKRPPPSPHRPK